MRNSTADEPDETSDSAAWRRWSAIEPILDAALDLPPNERDAYLNVATGDDAALRAAVEALLRSAEAADTNFALNAVAAYPQLIAQITAEESSVAQQIGPYRIVARAGEGGMGVVYVAERADDQYRSRVALKLMRTGIDDPVLVRRFLDERQILASLVHPGIARLYDGGVTPEGRPWFAMELVEGTPIGQYCDAKRLTINERLRLMLSLCDAVAYAHRHFVIHRDLKPSNILMDSEGRVRVVDFGIAKVVEATAESADAIASVPALTPGYASPELIRGQAVTMASDVYSLGVILYRLLTGRRPYRVSGSESAAIVRAVLEGDYVGPSEMASRADTNISESRRSTAGKLARRMRGDLDAILLKAMAKERERRYGTVDEFAADIRRHLAARPVSVRPARWWYRTTKFVRRNVIGVVAVAVIILVVTAFGVSMRAQLLQVDRERRVAEQVSNFLARLIATGNPLLARAGETVTMGEALDRALTRLHQHGLLEPAARARVYDEIGYALWQLDRHDRAREALDSAIVVGGRAGLDRLSLWGTRARLASVLLEQGMLVAAESVLRDVLAEQRHDTGDRSASVSLTLSYLGEIVAGLGRTKQAEQLLLEALEIQQSLVHQVDFEYLLPEVAGTQRLLASLFLDSELSREGRYLAEAESLSREALATVFRTYGDSAPRVERYYTTLARVQHRRGNPEAEPFLRGVHERHRRLWGEDHPFLERERLALAEFVSDRGALADAESLFVGIAHRMRRRGVKPAGFDTVLIGLGRVNLERGKAAAADTVLREVLEFRQRIFQPGDSRIAEAQALLGAALTQLRNYDEAALLLRSALPIVEKRWGDVDRRTVAARAAVKELARHTPP